MYESDNLKECYYHESNNNKKNNIENDDFISRYVYLYVFYKYFDFCVHFHWLLTMVLRTHTHMASNPRQITSADLFFFFFMPQNPSINHLNFYCIKQIDKIIPCVCLL